MVCVPGVCDMWCVMCVWCDGVNVFVAKEEATHDEISLYTAHTTIKILFYYYSTIILVIFYYLANIILLLFYYYSNIIRI